MLYFRSHNRKVKLSSCPSKPAFDFMCLLPFPRRISNIRPPPSRKANWSSLSANGFDSRRWYRPGSKNECSSGLKATIMHFPGPGSTGLTGGLTSRRNGYGQVPWFRVHLLLAIKCFQDLGGTRTKRWCCQNLTQFFGCFHHTKAEAQGYQC